jgi:lysozyme family protein
MASFDEAVKKVIWLEGGHVDDKDDPGGETMYGISSRAHPDLFLNGPPTRQQAIERYRRDYWHSLYDQIGNQKLASELMEFGVIAGRGVAIRLLQEAIRYAMPDRTRATEIVVDGRFGSHTLAAMNLCDPDKLIDEFRVNQIIRFVLLTDQKPPLKKYLKGWIRRAIA